MTVSANEIIASMAMDICMVRPVLQVKNPNNGVGLR